MAKNNRVGVRQRGERAAVGVEDDGPGRGAQAEEVQLAYAVLWQAIVDATSGVGSSRTATDCEQARMFLLATEGDWRTARRTWCDVAGIDPDAFESRVEGVLQRGQQASEASRIMYGDGVARIAPSLQRLLG